MAVAFAAIAVALVAAAITVPAVLSRPARYEAVATMEMDQPRLLITGTSDVVPKLTQLRLKYAPLAATDTITEAAASALGVPRARLHGAITVDTPPFSLLLNVHARAASAADAVRFANAITVALAAHANAEQAGLDVPLDQRYQLVPITPAGGAAKTSTGARQAASSAVAMGLAAGALAYAGMDALVGRRSRRARLSTLRADVS